MLKLKRNPVTVLRILFGFVWLIDAFFKGQPGFRAGFAASIQGVQSGQPGFIRTWIGVWASLATHTGQLLPDIIAITETALALALILGIVRRPVYVVGAVYALFVWAVGEGFGGPYVLGTTTDVGTGIIYAFVFASLFAMDTFAVAQVSLQRIFIPTEGQARLSRTTRTVASPVAASQLSDSAV